MFCFFGGVARAIFRALFGCDGFITLSIMATAIVRIEKGIEPYANAVVNVSSFTCLGAFVELMVGEGEFGGSVDCAGVGFEGKVSVGLGDVIGVGVGVVVGVVFGVAVGAGVFVGFVGGV